MIEPDDAFWKRKQAKALKRKVYIRNPRDKFLIVCEGAKTEPNYFRSFRLTSSCVKDVFGIGDNTEELVRRTIEYKKTAGRYGIRYDQIWCVFDKDAFPVQNFNDAIALANREGIRVAYSNEAFELWYLLHFDYLCTATNRADYITMLTRKLGTQYQKNSEAMYQKLFDKQANAIKNAKCLLASYSPCVSSQNNPSTTVHLLVEELNKFLNQ
jgi:hypothetical protein